MWSVTPKAVLFMACGNIKAHWHENIQASGLVHVMRFSSVALCWGCSPIGIRPFGSFLGEVMPATWLRGLSAGVLLHRHRADGRYRQRRRSR
jgi:hypothetical protein